MTSSTSTSRDSSNPDGKDGGEIKDRVMSGADAGKEKAAEGLSTAADKMRSDEDGVRSQLGNKAADAMERTADYLKDHDSNELMHDIEEFVKAHPLQAAAGALAAGSVLGKLVR
jgi:ElaB/YqjD/DUF883 family membrane-anchored ribosome-binding protein